MGCLQIHVVDSELCLPPPLLREPGLPEEILPYLFWGEGLAGAFGSLTVRWSGLLRDGFLMCTHTRFSALFSPRV